MNADGYSLTDGRFWRIVGYNWTPDERATLDDWYADDWHVRDEALRIALAAGNDPMSGSRLLRLYRLRWLQSP